MTIESFGVPLYQRLDLEQHGAALTGKLGNDPVEGTVTGGRVHLRRQEH